MTNLIYIGAALATLPIVFDFFYSAFGWHGIVAHIPAIWCAVCHVCIKLHDS